jgi:ABC-type phosphate/phosphonate transport system substrate-binding protein
VSEPPLIANARMYSVTPAVEEAWRTLLEHVFVAAGVADRFAYVPYPAPQPLEVLWRRPDVGCVFMCGYPIAMRLADVTPIAAPVPAAEWAEGRPVYRTDLIVAARSRFRTLADTFGGRAAWTVPHSHSGFNAFRHHLLAYRTADRPVLFGSMAANIVTARGILDEVAAGEIDVGPLDAYWHMLIRQAFPDLASKVRVIESTASAPMPAFVAGPNAPADVVARLKASFTAAAAAPWFTALAEVLLLQGFAEVGHANYEPTRRWEAEALEAGYPYPA